MANETGYKIIVKAWRSFDADDLDGHHEAAEDIKVLKDPVAYNDEAVADAWRRLNEVDFKHEMVPRRRPRRGRAVTTEPPADFGAEVVEARHAALAKAKEG